MMVFLSLARAEKLGLSALTCCSELLGAKVAYPPACESTVPESVSAKAFGCKECVINDVPFGGIQMLLMLKASVNLARVLTT